MLSFSQRRQIRSRTCAHGMLPRRDFCGVLPLTQKKGPKDWLAGGPFLASAGSPVRSLWTLCSLDCDEGTIGT